PFMLGRGGVYEAAIVGGQAFLLLGLVFAFDAVWKDDRLRRSRLRLAAAGLCWAFAIGCRASLAPAALLLVAGTAALVRRPGERPWRARLGSALWVGLPVAAGALGLLLYNKARFDSWLEFGLNHQLTTIHLLKGAVYVPANVFSYALRPMDVSCVFPYLRAVWDMGT